MTKKEMTLERFEKTPSSATNLAVISDVVSLIGFWRPSLLLHVGLVKLKLQVNYFQSQRMQLIPPAFKRIGIVSQHALTHLH